MIRQSFKGTDVYAGIVIFAWRVTWNYAYSPFNVSYSGAGVYARQEWKATLTVGIVLLTFLICWLPFFVLTLYSSLVRVHIIPGKNVLYTLH